MSPPRPALHPPRLPDDGGLPERRPRDAWTTNARVLSTYTAAGGVRRRRHDHGRKLHAESDLYVSRGLQSYSQTIFVLLEQQPGHAADPRLAPDLHRPHAAAPAGPGAAHGLRRTTGGDDHLAGRRLRRHHRRARLSGVVQPRRRPEGVLRRNIRTRLPDLLQEPHAHLRCSGARPVLHLFAPAGADGAIVSRQDPAERHHLRRGGRRDRSQRQPQHPGHPLRDRDQDQELLRRLPQRRRSRSGRRRHRAACARWARARPRAAPRPAWARGSRSPRS